MKTKLIALLLVVSSISVFGQKKKNGTVYIDHPAIDIIYQMYRFIRLVLVNKASTFVS